MAPEINRMNNLRDLFVTEVETFENRMISESLHPQDSSSVP
jgi:hypothetical protein